MAETRAIGAIWDRASRSVHAAPAFDLHERAFLFFDSSSPFIPTPPFQPDSQAQSDLLRTLSPHPAICCSHLSDPSLRPARLGVG